MASSNAARNAQIFATPVGLVTSPAGEPAINSDVQPAIFSAIGFYFACGYAYEGAWLISQTG